MKVKKENKGITLIALVITIIVLLILAGVAISMLSGENGILNRAAEAKEKTDESTAQEEVILAYNETLMKKSLEDGIDYADYMQGILQKGDVSATVTGDENNLEVTYNGYKFIIENGKITSSEKDTTGAIVSKITDAVPGDITTDKDGNKASGTETDPFQISSIEDLVAFADLVNNGLITSTDTVVELDESLDFKSSNSYVDSTRKSLTTYGLDGTTVLNTHTYSTSMLNSMTTGTGWEPIGVNSENGFLGTFDGNGNEIKGLYMNYSYTGEMGMAGLFALNCGIIQNLTVSGNVTGTFEGGSSFVIAGITAVNYGAVYNCTNKATITGIDGSGLGTAVAVAGITALNGGTVVNCSNSGNVIGKNDNTSNIYEGIVTGGIVGLSEGGMISNCSNTGKISAEKVYEGIIAGIVGMNEGTNVTNCYNTGSINVKNTVNFDIIGGIVGYNLTYTDNGSVTNCYNLGTITTSGGNTNGILKGGIIGYEGYFETTKNNYDGTGIGAIGGQNFYGVGEYASLTQSSIASYINEGTTPTTTKRTYASTGSIAEVLEPGSYVKYDTSSLSDYQIPQSLAGTSSYTASQTVQPSQYTGGWQVLSNDGTNVEIISSDKVTITNSYESGWANEVTLYGETGYKNAVNTLNTASQAFLNTTYGTSARSVGSSSNSRSTVSATLTYKPTDYTQLTDMEFYKDFANMCYSGTVTATSGNVYCLASRYCFCYSDYCCFNVNVADGPGDWYGRRIVRYQL